MKDPNVVVTPPEQPVSGVLHQETLHLEVLGPDVLCHEGQVLHSVSVDLTGDVTSRWGGHRLGRLPE